jgi:hypothetical protein
VGPFSPVSGSNRNRTGPVKIYGFENQFNRFFISVRFFQLIFLRFSRLIGYFEHPWLEMPLQ